MTRRTLNAIACAVPFLGAIETLLAAENGYYSQPAIHENKIIFVSEGDLWTATIPDAQGENAIVAYRLTSGDGAESMPAISPDGTRVAFSAEYDGNTDVYVMPIDGGAPRRLTFHPTSDEALGWLPDSRTVLFRSNRRHPTGHMELWRISATGGMPMRYEFGECTQVAFSSTGRRIAFTPWSNENWNWKRYRGGTAPDIWIGDIAANTYKNITNDAANDMFPMWLLGKLYFLSDRDGTANLWSMSPEGGDAKQHTKFARNADDPTAIEGYDVRWPSGEVRPRGTRIVFCQAGQLAVFDATNETVRRLNIQLASDRVALRQRFAPLKNTLTEYTLSPDGEKLIVGARGELMQIPIEGGVNRQMTRTSGAREWGACYLGDDRIAMISDQTGDQRIAVVALAGSEGPSAITDARQSWLFPPQCSPDGRWIAFGDNTLRLHLVDTHTLEERVVDQSEAGEITDYRFSPDNMWLAYTMPMPNNYSIARIYSLRTNQSFDVSGGLSNDTETRWDPAGKYLYYLSDRHYNPVMGSYDFEHIYISTTRVVAIPLAENTPPPDPEAARAAKFDMEHWASGGPEENDEAEAEDAEVNDVPPVDGEDAADAEDEAKPNNVQPVEIAAAPMRIDTDNIAARQFLLPIEPGAYTNLEAIYGGVTYVLNPLEGLLDDDWPNVSRQGKGRLIQFDILQGEPKEITAGVDEYALSRNCRTIAVPVVNGFTIFSISAAPPQLIDLTETQLRVDIAEEWKQIFAESWRLQRDFYWAPNMAGLNWEAMREKYSALLPRVGIRAELNDVIGEMIGELGTSHTYIWGGEAREQPKPVSVGLLGADTDFDGSFRITRIIPAPAYTDELKSPLRSPHLNVKEGDAIVGVNGIALKPGDNIYEALQDMAGKRITLTIADDASGVNRRDIEIETLEDEAQIRYFDWVESNLAYVREQTDGKVGYIHIPDMGGGGLSVFSRYFYPQSRMAALVIDVRDNGGGFVSQMIIERLSREPIGYGQPRHGSTERYPFKSVNAHMAAIIDQFAGSDGDIFPGVFKRMKLGPLIGKRTWGGVIGIRGDKLFVDFGLSTQPEYAWWEEAAGWTIENYGVEPDIEVDINPADRVAGRDPQLDKAIEVLMQKLTDEPIVEPVLPAFPVRVP